jgi:hypothetical protein
VNNLTKKGIKKMTRHESVRNILKIIVYIAMKSFLILSVVLTLAYCISCKTSPSKKPNLISSKIYEYEAMANGFAGINLSFFKNNKFNLNIAVLKSKTRYMYKGSWQNVRNNLILKFEKKESLSDIFDIWESHNMGNRIKIIDDFTVSMPNNLEYIWIFNVLCRKER